MASVKASNATAKFQLKEVPDADRATMLNFHQIENRLNAVAGHLGQVTRVINTGSTGPSAADLASLQAEIDVINLEITNIQNELNALTPGLPPTYVLDAATAQFIAVREDTPGTAAILDNTTDSGDSILGLTKLGGPLGASVPVFANGSTVINPAWTWTPNLPVFATTAGTLTQTAPTTGYIASLGYALDPTTLLVNLSKPVFQNSNDTLPQAMYMGIDGLPTTLAKFGYLKARTVVTTNVASLSGLGAQNGITPVDGTRILLTGQTTASQNGLWSTHTGAWTRPLEFAANTHASGTLVYAQLGTLNSNTIWQCTTTPVSDQVGINNLAWTLASAGGTVTSVSSGNLTPLFTVSVATATTTPAFTFSPVLQSHGLFYASDAVTNGLAPSFRAIVGTDLPLATTSLFGAVKPDGTTITISAGVISAVGAGSVTSVALALPASTFSISGSPVTSTGTLTGAFVNQSANTFLRGPTSGGAATPTWGGIVAADIAGLTGVTSVSLATSVAGFFQSGSPVTGSGTLNLGINSQSANTAFIAPNGSSGVPTWRVLAVPDLPTMIIASGIGSMVTGPATAASMWTQTINANTIPATGRAFRARYALSFTGTAITASSSSIAVSVGGTSLGLTGFLPAGVSFVWLEFDITRLTSTTGALSGFSGVAPVTAGLSGPFGSTSLSFGWTGSMNILFTFTTTVSGAVCTGLNSVVQLL